MSKQPVNTAQIAEAAYFLWLEEGQPEGHAHDHWERATAALTPAAKPGKPRAKASATKAAPKKTAAPKTAKPKTAKPRKKTDA